MKKWIIGLGIIIAMLASGSLDAQVVVKIKPDRPKVIVVKPSKVKRGYIWREGHWRWNRKAQRYTWVKARWIKARTGFVWVPGHWQQVPKGWMWIEGHWKRG